MNRAPSPAERVPDLVADQIIEDVLETYFQAHLRGETPVVPKFVLINGHPYTIAAHVGAVQ